MVYVPGETYDIPCSEIILKGDLCRYFLPVIDLPHTDTAFDFPHMHDHIDGRFESHRPMKLR